MNKPESSSFRDPLAVGDRVLDRYVVVDRFETGGTSVVYLGEDERLARPVCIKVFSSLRDKEWIYRATYQHFVQEAFALSKLSHPNTLRIYDFGHLPALEGGDDGPPFQVSEFMNGGTLSHLVRKEGPMPPAEALKVVAAICGALDEAHHADIIHRDIKPKNILFGTTGQSRQAKLADFGIAKSLAMDTEALRNKAGDTQVVAGRRLLMFSGLWAAPEQLSGQPIGGWTDLYSFALVTIFMLTGRTVFNQTEPGEAYRQRSASETLIDEALADGDLPPAVVTLLKRACEFEPERRPGSPGSFATLLADAFERGGRRRLPLEARERRESPAAPSSRATTEVDPPAATPVPGTEEIATLEQRPRPSSRPPPLPQHTVLAAAPPPPLAALPTPPEAQPSGPPHRLPLSAEPQRLGDRTSRFVPFGDGGTVDLTCAGGMARVRVSLIPIAASQFAIHVRGLNCFVKKNGGRPSGATQLEQSGGIELVAPNQASLATASVQFGSPAAGHSVFPVGAELVAIGTHECPRAIALDFGPGAECLFLYEPRPAPSDERGVRGRRR